MVSESDFIAAFQAYDDALEDPASKIDTIRPLVNDHLEQLIARLPGTVVQTAARERAMSELDRIEEMAKEKVVEVADKISGLGRPESREEFDAARIEGATHMTRDLMQEVMGQWEPETAIVIVDHQGQQGLDAAAYFLGHGMKNVRCLRGGIDAWSLEVDDSVPRYEFS